MTTLQQNHADMVAVLAKPGEDVINDLTPQNAHLLHMAVGVCGEAGELLDCIKKVSIYKKNIDLENLIEELGDLEFYMQGIRQEFGITRERILQHNMDKLHKRYNDKKYSNQQAQDRADKL